MLKKVMFGDCGDNGSSNHINRLRARPVTTCVGALLIELLVAALEPSSASTKVTTIRLAGSAPIRSLWFAGNSRLLYQRGSGSSNVVGEIDSGGRTQEIKIGASCLLIDAASDTGLMKCQAQSFMVVAKKTGLSLEKTACESVAIPADDKVICIERGSAKTIEHSRERTRHTLFVLRNGFRLGRVFPRGRTLWLLSSDNHSVAVFRNNRLRYFSLSKLSENPPGAYNNPGVAQAVDASETTLFYGAAGGIGVLNGANGSLAIIRVEDATILDLALFRDRRVIFGAFQHGLPDRVLMGIATPKGIVKITDVTSRKYSLGQALASNRLGKTCWAFSTMPAVACMKP